MTTKRDYYDILEIGRDASEEDVRKAFRKKALEFHPDRNKDPDAPEKFKEVNEAYQVLTDPERRQRYDRFGHQAGNGGGEYGVSPDYHSISMLCTSSAPASRSSRSASARCDSSS